MRDLILDTETTGLGVDAEIVEIAIIDRESGEVLLDTLVRPTAPIPEDAVAIHGITDAMVKDAPAWPDIHPRVQELVDQCGMLYIYNSEYDLRLINQTAVKHDLSMALSCQKRCVMTWYTDVETELDPLSSGRWRKLVDLADIARFSEDVQAHRALGDCLMTRHVIGYIESLEAELTRRRKRRESSEKSRTRFRDRVQALIPDDFEQYPYYGQANRPAGYKTLSQLRASDLGRAVYAGQCCSSYGHQGHLFKIEPENG